MKRRLFLKVLSATSLNLLMGKRLIADPGKPIQELIARLEEKAEVYLRANLNNQSQIEQLNDVYNKRFANTEAKAWISPYTDEAIEICMQWIHENQQEFSVKGGGHSYEGHCLCSGIVIDMKYFDQIQIDQKNQLVTIGAGVRLGELYENIGKKGFALAAGTCPDVGAVGHSLGGGIGMLSRQLGLASDQIIELQFISPKGVKVKVNQDLKPNLFWMAKGAGQQNLGVVTSVTYRITPLEKVFIYSSSTELSFKQAADFLSRWQFVLGAPEFKNLSSVIYLSVDPDSRTVWMDLTGVEIVDRHVISLFFERLEELANVSFKYKTRKRSFLGMTRFYSDEGRPVYMKGKSDIVKSNDIKRGLSRQDFIELFSKMTPKVWMALEGMGEKASIADRASAIDQDTLFIIQWSTVWEDANENMPLEQIRNFYQATRSLFPWKSHYVNYPDDDLKDRSQKYYGDAQKKILSIKQSIDSL